MDECAQMRDMLSDTLPSGASSVPAEMQELLAVGGVGSPLTAKKSGGAGGANTPVFSPLYRQIKALIMQQLEAGEWRPGEMIPSENELALRFNVSQGTVRKAVDEMAAEKLLLRRQGKGTFVASHNQGCSDAACRFQRLYPDVGAPWAQAALQDEVLECWRAKAGHEAARVLGLAFGAPITIVRRLLKAAGGEVKTATRPLMAASAAASVTASIIGVEEIYLPGELCAGLDLELLRNYDGSFYSLLESRFSLHLLRAEERLHAVLADGLNARLLGLKEGSPLLEIERVSFTYGDRRVEWRRSLFSTAQHHYFSTLS